MNRGNNRALKYFLVMIAAVCFLIVAGTVIAIYATPMEEEKGISEKDLVPSDKEKPEVYGENKTEEKEPEGKEGTIENEEGYSAEEIKEMVIAYHKRHGLYVNQYYDASEEEEGIISVHCYDVIWDDEETSHTATSEWYYIDRHTGKGVNFLDEEIDFNK